MPLDVAMEEPDAWVVGDEAEDHVAVGSHEHGVAAHGHGREFGVVLWVVHSGLFLRAVDYLEVVTVKMEGMLAWIHIVQNNLDNFVLLEHLRMCIVAVNIGVCRQVSRAEHGVEGRYDWSYVGNVAEEGTVTVSGDD